MCIIWKKDKSFNSQLNCEYGQKLPQILVLEYDWLLLAHITVQ